MSPVIATLVVGVVLAVVNVVLGCIVARQSFLVSRLIQQNDRDHERFDGDMKRLTGELYRDYPPRREVLREYAAIMRRLDDMDEASDQRFARLWCMANPPAMPARKPVCQPTEEDAA